MPEYGMPISFITLGVGFVACLAIWRVGAIWWKFRGPRVVTCPETKRPAGVAVDVASSLTATLGKTPQLRLSECSRWPERAGCGQECLSEIRQSGADCLVRNIIATWYRDRDCAACGQPIGAIDWTGSHPALLMADQVSVEWKQIPAEQL